MHSSSSNRLWTKSGLFPVQLCCSLRASEGRLFERHVWLTRWGIKINVLQGLEIGNCRHLARICRKAKHRSLNSLANPACTSLETG
ncbi:protein of unknown function [Pseudorhizobium banfieldiae]|uniref:Uncharacterized protein n=1 Tax=Pseudorhizobium banfieldiae TaxID=1125847 RepID=L0NB50_9HYPH|nr:protein of unknown function [Pseudorhizobium banfieldiae]